MPDSLDGALPAAAADRSRSREGAYLVRRADHRARRRAHRPREPRRSVRRFRQGARRDRREIPGPAAGERHRQQAPEHVRLRPRLRDVPPGDERGPGRVLRVRRAPARDGQHPIEETEPTMKILYTPLMIVPSVSPEQRAAILEAAGPGSTFVEAKDAATQRREIVDTDALFGRVSPEIFGLAKRLRYYQSIGAGVDSILTQELVESDVPLASEKGGVGIHLAEHAFALLLALTRGLHTAIRKPDYSLREPIRIRQLELYDLTMGIVGFGGTGREVARRALGFGMRVIAVDIEDVAPEPGVEAIWKPDRLGDLLGASDAVVSCVPLP